jgi:hypothetical protein
VFAERKAAIPAREQLFLMHRLLLLAVAFVEAALSFVENGSPPCNLSARTDHELHVDLPGKSYKPAAVPSGALE